eukprot:g3961.t1
MSNRNRNRRRNNNNRNRNNTSNGFGHNASRGTMPRGLKKWKALTHGNSVVAVAYWPEKGKVLSAGGSEIKMWDANTSNCEHTIRVGGEIGSLLCTGGWLFCGFQAPAPPIFPECNVGQIKAWNLATTPPQEFAFHFGPQTPFSHPNKVTALTALMDKGLVISAGREGLIRVWRFDGTSSKFVHHCSLEGHVRNVTSLLVTPEGLLFSASEDYTIRKWQFSPDMTAKCADFISSAKSGHTNTISSLVLVKTAVNGQPLTALISGARDKTICVWNATTMAPMMPPKQMGGDVLALLTFAKDNFAAADRPATLFVGMAGGEIRALKLPAFEDAGQVNRGGIGHFKQVQDLKLGPEGHFFSASADGNIYIWQFAQQQ